MEQVLASLEGLLGGKVIEPKRLFEGQH